MENGTFTDDALAQISSMLYVHVSVIEWSLVHKNIIHFLGNNWKEYFSRFIFFQKTALQVGNNKN